MQLAELLTVLHQNPMATIQVKLANGTLVPAHFHVTEVGRVQKDFIDCGGTVRSITTCVLQVWVAGDVDHRLDSTKLARILEMAAPLLKTTDLPVEIEYEAGLISQYPLTQALGTPMGIFLHLGSKHTACLAEDRCGIAPADDKCCATSGCC